MSRGADTSRAADTPVFNSLASGRRLARRVLARQTIAAVLVGVAFLPMGARAAAAAMVAAGLVTAGTALLSVNLFAAPSGAAVVLGRLLLGMAVRWAVLIGGLVVMLGPLRLPPLPIIAGLVTAYAAQVWISRDFKG